MNPRFWDRRMETLAADRRHLLHDHRLHWQLRRCWDASPWHRARLEQAGIEPSTFQGLGALRRIPLLTDADLQEAAVTHLTESLAVAPRMWWAMTVPDVAQRERVRPARVLTDGDVIHQADLASRALWAAGALPTSVVSVSATAPGASADVQGGPASPDGFAAEAVSSGLERIRSRPWRGDGSRPTAFLVQLAEDDAPPVPASDGPVAGIRWTNADTGTGTGIVGAGADRHVAVSIPYLGPTVAYTCAERSGLHWADDHLLVEVVHPVTHSALTDGQVGAVVMTELTREGTPLLRYWTGLEAALITEPCACGRTSARSPFVRHLAGTAPTSR